MQPQALPVLRAAHLDELGHRYGAVLAAHRIDALVLHSGSRQLRRAFDDAYWPLCPLAPFAHFLPLAHPECLILLVPGARPRLVRFIDESYWEQAPPDEVPSDGLDVIEVRDPQKARDHLPPNAVFIGAQGAAVWDCFPPERRNPPAVLAALDSTRVHKTPYEVACLAEANRRAAVGHRRITQEFQQTDLSELHLHLSYLAATFQDDPETPYKNIVARGPHAATLHHVNYDRKDSSGDGAGSLLLDAGATFCGYASDITRTHVRGRGEAPDRFRALCAAMDAMQRRLCGEVRVGLPYEALHDRSHEEIAEVLRGAGLCRVSAEEAVSTGLTRAFFPHGLGHSLGLQTHDVGCAVIKPRADNPWLRNTATIEPGQVFTIEPGLYFIASLLDPMRKGPQAQAVDWPVVDLLAPYGGIRVEDDVLVTPEGVRNLTREVLG